MSERSLKRRRIISVAAATCIAIACGTNYAYSAWGPQYAQRMNFSATQSNIIGAAGNIGMYASGIPTGLLIDSKGPRVAVMIGSLALAAGYFPIRKAYDDGPGSIHIAVLFLLYFLTGLGSCSAFSASVKTSALNWPNHRGTATAFPLSGFGLSAFFFSTISGFAFPDNTSGYLLMLAIGTSGLIFISFFFLHVIPIPNSYSAIPTGEDELSNGQTESNALHRTKSNYSETLERETSNSSGNVSSPAAALNEDENASLISSESSGPGDVGAQSRSLSGQSQRSQCSDVTGLALLPKRQFWQLWAMLGLLTGVGLMSINNIGNDAQALWIHYDDSVSKKLIAQRQLTQVSVISFMSFCGRLLSGIGSDIVVKRLNSSRYWCLTASSVVFTVAQLCAVKIENPHSLWILSALTGLAYGALFGVYPALVVDAFGVHGFSLNWGYMTLSPVICGNLFNLIYGAVYDHHSIILPDGDRECRDGLQCYALAYWITFGACLLGILGSFWCIRQDSTPAKVDVQNEHQA